MARVSAEEFWNEKRARQAASHRRVLSGEIPQSALSDIPEKRDVQGIAQGRLAISVVRAFISHAHNTRQERDVLPFVEEVRRIALNEKLARVYYEYGFDVLSAVPIELCKGNDFLSRRWPQIQPLVAEQRESQAKLCRKYPPWPGGIHP